MIAFVLLVVHERGRFPRRLSRARGIIHLGTLLHEVTITALRTLAKDSNGSQSSKFQAPTSREAPNSNIQSRAQIRLGVWNLKFLWSLEVGIWSFLLRLLTLR